MYLFAPFILQNPKKFLRANPELWGCATFGPKMTHLSWTKLLWYKHYYYFHLPISPFHCARFKKILTADPELWGCAIFGPKMVHLPQTKIWLSKIWRTKRQMEGRTDGRTIFYRTLPDEAGCPKNKETHSIARKIFISQHRNVENIQHVLETQFHQPEDRKSS